jgi:hypothetical protein
VLIVLVASSVAPMTSGVGFAENESASVEQARKAADTWLALIDKGDYRSSWIKAADFFKDRVTMDQWVQEVGAVREPLGVVIKRKLKDGKFMTSMPAAPDGKYVVLQYDTSFAHKRAAIETVTPMMDKDGEWRVSGYYIR